MNQSIKAALLSALVFPGAGQISVGHIKRGWVIIVINIVILYFIISEVMQQALKVITEMQKKGLAINVETISNTTHKVMNFSDNTFLNLMFIIIIVGWLASTIDAFFLGRKFNSK